MPAIPAKKTVLWEQYDEVCSELRNALEENRQLNEECRYLHDYNCQKGLDAAFAGFRKNAHEESDSELPFPHLVMDEL